VSNTGTGIPSTPPGFRGIPHSTIFSPKSFQSQVSPGGMKGILASLEQEKKLTIEKFDKAIAMVEVLVPRDVNVSVSFAVAENDREAFKKEAAATERVAAAREVAAAEERVAISKERVRIATENVAFATKRAVAAEKRVAASMKKAAVRKIREDKRARKFNGVAVRRVSASLRRPLVGHQLTVLKLIPKRDSINLPNLVKRAKLERSHVAGILTILTRRGFAKRVGRGQYARAANR